MGYFNLSAAVICFGYAIEEFARLKNTKHSALFWHLIFTGLNLYFANHYFGWIK